jgi:uncharacterized protein (TIRG00374 family)
MNKTLQRIVGVGVPIAAITWAVTGVDFGVVVRTWTDANRWLLVAVLGLTTTDLVFRALAWKVTIGPLKRTSMRHVLPSYLIGMFSNVVLPMKLGDVAGSYYLGRSERMSKTALVSTALIQRIFEGMTLVVVIGAVGMLSSLPLIIQRGVVLFVMLVALVAGGMYLVVAGREKILRLVTYVMQRYFRRVSRRVPVLVHALFEGAAAIRNARVVALIVVLHLCSWAVQVAMVKLMAQALHLPLDFPGAAVVLIVINIGIALPLAPGNIGTYQLLAIVALSLFSVSKSRALGFGVLFQLIQGVPVVIGGGVSLLIATFGDGPGTSHVDRGSGRPLCH